MTFHHWYTFAGALLGFIVLVAGTQYLLTQFVLPSGSTKSFSEIHGVHRRHFESINSWEKRIVAVHEAAGAAERAFMEESERLGTYQRINERGYIWSLPPCHPLALKVLHARHPDGPSLEELEKPVVRSVAL